MLTIRSARTAAADPRGRLRIWWSSAVGVTAIVLVTYTLWLAAALRHTSPESFIHLGRTLVNKSHASPIINERAASYPYDGNVGFDGEYAYFIAVDPAHARGYLDSPAYRFTRIVYPLTSRALALGRPSLIPYTLLLVNLLMIGTGTAALAAWLRRHQVSPWYAAVYGFYPGILIAMQRDTTEIMAYGLVALAVLIFDRSGIRLFISAILFALAILTRETAAFFAAGYSLSLLLSAGGPTWARLREALPRVALFTIVWALPIAAWKIALRLWLGSFGLDGHIELVPFHGILSWYPFVPGVVEEVRIVVIPAVLCGIAAGWALLRGNRRVETWLLLANVIILVVLLERPAYNDISSSGRITVGVVLAAILSLPWLQRQLALIWAAAALWLSPMFFWLFLPVARIYLGAVAHRLRH